MSSYIQVSGSQVNQYINQFKGFVVDKTTGQYYWRNATPSFPAGNQLLRGQITSDKYNRMIFGMGDNIVIGNNSTNVTVFGNDTNIGGGATNLFVVNNISGSRNINFISDTVILNPIYDVEGGLYSNQVIVGNQYVQGRIDFNTASAEPGGVAGRLKWNDTDGTLDLGLKGGNVTLQIGQEQVARVVNKTGANLLETDFRVVRVRSVSEGGAQGQRLAVVLAQANNDFNSAETIGVVTENIDDNQEGFITILGQVKEINTTGAKSYGGLETWVDGDMLFLDSLHPGYLTKVKPSAPNHMVVVGYVEYAHSQHGKIFVKVQNGYELDELHNVHINTGSLADGQVLSWNSSSQYWTNTTPSSGGSTPTGSLLVTASATNNVITFTKGDGSTFPVTVATGSIPSTGSLITTASVSGNTITFTKGDGSTFPITVDTGSGGGSSYSFQTIVGSATGLGAGLTRYGNVAGTTAESQNRLPVASNCTIDKLYVRTTATMPANSSLAVTLFKNGSATALTLTIAAGTVAGTYSDLVNSVSFTEGDGLNMRYVNAGTATAAASSGTGYRVTI